MTKLAALGLLNPGLAYALGLLGLASITASMSVLLWATEPLLTMLLAVLVLRERIATATGVAVAAALARVLLVVYAPGASGAVAGVAFAVAAVMACALYAVLTRRLLLDDSSLVVVLVQQIPHWASPPSSRSSPRLSAPLTSACPMTPRRGHWLRRPGSSTTAAHSRSS